MKDNKSLAAFHNIRIVILRLLEDGGIVVCLQNIIPKITALS